MTTDLINQMLRTGALLGPYRPVKPVGMGRLARLRREIRRLAWRIRGV